MSRTTKVLAIDGGGIRGIIPAIVLAEIERRTQQRISELFDLIAGTSAGGILALGLTMPGPDRRPKYEAEALIELFRDEGKRIFSRPFPRVIPYVRNLFEAKYSSKGIEDVLYRYFEDTRLKVALSNVIVTSYEIERRVPFFFKSSNALKRGESYDFPMWQVARATSAAPTYFEPFRIEAHDLSEYYAPIDGGVFANNPALCAYAEASHMQAVEDSQIGRNDLLVVSLGSGELTRPLYYQPAKGISRNWGIARWVQPILSVVFDGVEETVHYQMNQLLPPKAGIRRYYRFQRLLREGNDDLDDASDRNLRDLILTARAIIDEHSEELDELCAQLIR